MQVDGKDNRNCGCNNTVVTVSNTMMPSNSCGCNDFVDGVESEIRRNCMCNNELREDMIEQIKCYNFAVIELALYLDTHPDDSRALCLHKKYCKELKELKDKYQKVYGPLTIEFPCNKWRWIEEPWVSFGLGKI